MSSIHDSTDRHETYNASYSALSKSDDEGHVEVHEIQSTDRSSLQSKKHTINSLQSRFPSLNSAGQRKLVHQYRPLKQFRLLLQRLVARLLFTLILCVLFTIVCRQYASFGFLDNSKKREFNALSLALALVLGINAMSALKSMAEMMKWKILASGKWTAREIDLLLALSSFSKVTELMKLWIKSRHYKSALLCWIWILLGISAQVAVSLLGLAYNLNDAQSTQPGMVNVSNITQYMDQIAANYGYGVHMPDQPSDQVYLAHQFGQAAEVGVTLTDDPEDTDIGHINNGGSIAMLIQDNSTAPGTSVLTYRYIDYSGCGGDMLSSCQTINSNRSVTVNTTCEEGRPIVQGQNGLSENITVQLAEDHEWKIDWITARIPKMPGGGGTTYINTGMTCGNRCSIIWFFQFRSVDDPDHDTGDFFECQVDVSKIANASQFEHELSDAVALAAASSIGSSGFTYHVNDTMVKSAGVQFFTVTNATYLGLDLRKIDQWNPRSLVALAMSYFSIGSLATMDTNNFFADNPVPGTVVVTGSQLVVNWEYVWLNLGLILGFQFALAVVTVFCANSVFQKDDSDLATARLLRPIVERLGDSGSCASGPEIAESLKMKMTYGVRSNVNRNVHHLDIGEDLQSLQVFPKGSYD